LERAVSLIIAIAGGEMSEGSIDVYSAPLVPTTVTTSYSYIHKLSGKNYPATAINQILIALGFTIEQITNDTLTITVPSNKTDISQPADIVEEILRIDGLDNITIPERLNISLIKSMPNDRENREKVSEILCGTGFQEIITNSIVNSKYYPDRTDLVKMINNLSSELDVMRPSLTEGGLEVINYNCNRKNNNLSLFEFGNIYYCKNDKYAQESRLSLWITGSVSASNWEHKAEIASVYYLKGILNNLALVCGIKNYQFSYTDTSTGLKWKNQELCTIKQVDNARLNEFEIKQDVYVAEIFWENWLKAMAAGKTAYKEVAKFPQVQRDLAIIIDAATPYKQVQEATEQLKIDALSSFDLFDIFESDKLGKGKKSFALNFTFQLQDRTLTDTEVEELMKKLSDTYKNKLGALIRE